MASTTNFETADVNAATQQSSFGYHHGPITLPQPDPNNPPQQPRLSRLHGNICWVHVSGNNMCGQILKSSPALYRHMKQFHGNQWVSPDRRQITSAERAAGMNALRKYVRDGHWRNASFINEPGRGPLSGPLNAFCDEAEALARTNATFRANFGDGQGHFHRPHSPYSRKRSTKTKSSSPTLAELMLKVLQQLSQSSLSSELPNDGVSNQAEHMLNQSAMEQLSSLFQGKAGAKKAPKRKTGPAPPRHPPKRKTGPPPPCDTPPPPPRDTPLPPPDDTPPPAPASSSKKSNNRGNKRQKTGQNTSVTRRSARIAQSGVAKA